MYTAAIHLLTLVVFTRIGELFPVLMPLHLGKVGFAFSAMVLLAAGGRTFGELPRMPLLRHVLLLLAIAACGVPFSVWRAGALEGLEAYAQTVYVFVALVLLAVRGRVGVLRMGLLLGVMVLGTCLLLERGFSRAYVSTTYDANDLAVLFAMFIPVLVAEGMAGVGGMRVAGWVGAATAFVGMAMTQSRGGLIALGVMAVQVVLSSRRRVPLLVLLVVAAVVFYHYADASYWDRFSILGDAEDDYNVSDKTGRIELWKSGLEMTLAKPFLGVGIGQFAPANFMYGNGVYLTAHNAYIQIAAETGLVSLCIYLLMLRGMSRIISQGVARAADDVRARSRWLGLRYGLTAFMTGILFISKAYGATFYCFVALVVAMDMTERAASATREAGERWAERAAQAGRVLVAAQGVPPSRRGTAFTSGSARGAAA
ncbi:O-antigen ligase family protein [Nitratidesulfovibrio sp.]|uniref:O-antigen ligase family protein n=1 Tax=Nitratidesulfovibrio sp. TaxID=2802297 RepID=UPI0033412EDA